MTQLYIFSVQSVTGAVMTIVGLLLVVAIIGYVTAWFYAKSVYTPIIKRLEGEKADLQKQVADLKENVRKLNDIVDNLNKKVSGLEKDIQAKDKLISERNALIEELKNPRKQ
jgi:peptidoglycan hydrolase CwlO-like protein